MRGRCAFDTVAASMSGADENSPSEVGPILGRLKELCEPFAASLVLVHHATAAGHHSGRGGNPKPRGATNWACDTDWSYFFHRSGRSNRFDIRTYKLRDGQDPPTLTIDAPVVTLPEFTGVRLDLVREGTPELKKEKKVQGPALSATQRELFNRVAPHLGEPRQLAEILRLSGVDRDQWNRGKEKGIATGLYCQPGRGQYGLGELGRQLLVAA